MVENFDELLREHEALMLEHQRLLREFYALRHPTVNAAAHMEHRFRGRAFRLLLANHRLAREFVRNGLV